MTDEQKFKFWQEYKGKEVEVSNNANFYTYGTIVLHCLKNYYDKHGSQYSEFISKDGTWYLYARPIQKKERLMMAEELCDKWIVWGVGQLLQKVISIDTLGTIKTLEMTFKSVKHLHESGGKWNNKPSFEGLNSLMVEMMV